MRDALRRTRAVREKLSYQVTPRTIAQHDRSCNWRCVWNIFLTGFSNIRPGQWSSIKPHPPASSSESITYHSYARARYLPRQCACPLLCGAQQMLIVFASFARTPHFCAISTSPANPGSPAPVPTVTGGCTRDHPALMSPLATGSSATRIASLGSSISHPWNDRPDRSA